MPVFSGVSPMVQSAKSVAMNIEDPMAVDGWRRRNGLVSDQYFNCLFPPLTADTNCGHHLHISVRQPQSDI